MVQGDNLPAGGPMPTVLYNSSGPGWAVLAWADNQVYVKAEVGLPPSMLKHMIQSLQMACDAIDFHKSAAATSGEAKAAVLKMMTGSKINFKPGILVEPGGWGAAA